MNFFSPGLYAKQCNATYKYNTLILAKLGCTLLSKLDSNP